MIHQRTYSSSFWRWGNFVRLWGQTGEGSPWHLWRRRWLNSETCRHSGEKKSPKCHKRKQKWYRGLFIPLLSRSVPQLQVDLLSSTWWSICTRRFVNLTETSPVKPTDLKQLCTQKWILNYKLPRQQIKDLVWWKLWVVFETQLIDTFHINSFVWFYLQNVLNPRNKKVFMVCKD